MPSKDPFYGSAAWKKQRDACFARDGYACRVCGRRGTRAGGRARLTADHVVPLRKWRARGYRAEDYPVRLLVTKCAVCHGKSDGGRRY